MRLPKKIDGYWTIRVNWRWLSNLIWSTDGELIQCDEFFDSKMAAPIYEYDKVIDILDRLPQNELEKTMVLYTDIIHTPNYEYHQPRSQEYRMGNDVMKEALDDIWCDHIGYNVRG